MADIFRLSALSENTNLQTRYNNMLAGNLPANGIYESIQTVTVGSGGASSVSFTSIPSTYKHLQIRAIGKDNRANYATNFYAQFNSDTSASYDDHSVSGDGASASASFSGTSQTSVYVGRFTGATNSTNIFGVSIIDILDYTNTSKYKTLRALSGYDNNEVNPGFVGLSSGLWQNTSAITSITIIPVTTPIQQYSTFALYGIKG